MSIRVLVADNAKILRDAIRKLLDKQPAIEIVGEAPDFAQTIKMVDELKPQLAIVDMNMPIGSNFTSTDITDRMRSSGVLILGVSVCLDQISQQLAKAFGAVLLDKMKLTQELVPAVMKLASNSASALSAIPPESAETDERLSG